MTLRTALRTMAMAGLLAATLIITPASAQNDRNGVLSLTPATGTVQGKDGLTVTVYADSGETAVNGVQAELTYDPKLLQYASVDGSQSAYDVAAPVSTEPGLVRIPRGNMPPGLTGKRIVATVHFNVVGAAAKATINFANGSSMLTADDAHEIWNGATAGGTFALSDPVAPSANIESKTEGYPVAIVVRDKRGVSIQGAAVTLGNNRTATTDVKGVASFVNVPEGQYDASVTRDGATTTQNIAVDKSDNKNVQEHSFKLTAATSKQVQVPYTGIIIGLMLLLLAGVIAWRWHKRVLAHHIAQHTNTMPKEPLQ